MRIAILTAIHNRIELTEIFIERTKRAIEEANTTNEYVLCSVISIDSKKPKNLDGRQMLITYTDNDPLGKKWNAGMRHARTYADPDYVMILGSDDLISSSLLELIDHKINQGYEFISFKDLYFYSLNRKRVKFGECGYWDGRGQNRSLGPARVCHRRILEKINWAPWGETKNSGLDGSFIKNIKDYIPEKKKILLSLKETNTYCLDIKTEGNINGIGNFELEPIKPEVLMSKFMDKDEIEAVLRYKELL